MIQGHAACGLTRSCRASVRSGGGSTVMGDVSTSTSASPERLIAIICTSFDAARASISNWLGAPTVSNTISFGRVDSVILYMSIS